MNIDVYLGLQLKWQS